MPDPGKRAERRHCRFSIGAYPTHRQLEKAKYRAAEQFITDMAKRGYEYIGESGRLPPAERGFKMAFKGAHIETMNLDRPRRPPSSRQMLPQVMQGARFRSEREPAVFTVPHFSETETWDYDLSAVFVRDNFLMDIPHPHEEIRL